MLNEKIVMLFVLFILLSISLSGCMMMGMSKKKDDGSKMGMMKCGGMMGGGMMGSASHDDNNHDMSKEKNPKAYKVAKRYCTQCHSLKEKTTHNGRDWNPTLMRMYAYMQNQNLMVPSESEKGMISTYYKVEN